MTNHPSEKLWTRQYNLIMLLNLSSFIVHFILLVAMPLYIKSIGGNNTAAGLATGIYSFSAMLMRPVIGYFLDNHGRKMITLLGFIPMIAGVIMLNFTDSVTLNLVIRLIQGIGFSIISTAFATIVTDLVPKSRMSEGIGYYAVVVTVCNAVGPLIGLTILGAFGYDFLFMIIVPLSFVSVILAFFLSKDKRELHHDDTPVKGLALLKKVYSIEPKAIPASIMMVLASLSYGALITFVASYGYSLGIENMQFFFVIYPVMVILSRLFAGKAGDRFGYQVVIIPGMVLAVIALLMIAGAKSMLAFSIAAALYGVGYGTLQPTFNAIAVKDVDQKRRGAANATFYIALDLGIGGGSILLGYISNYLGYSAIYIISAVSVALSLVIYLFSRYLRNSQS